MLLLYLCPVIFKFLLKEEVYEVFLLLHAAVFIMNSDILIESYLSDADKFMTEFVSKSANIFGKHFVVYNVHSAMHLAGDVARFGKFKNFWAYQFEDFLGKVKKQVQSSNRPLQQIIRRLVEKEQAEDDSGQTTSKEELCGLFNEHCNGS